MAQRVIAGGGDQEGGEKNISHFPVEEVQPVDRLCYLSGFGTTCVLVFRALHKKTVRTMGPHPASLSIHKV